MLMSVLRVQSLQTVLVVVAVVEVLLLPHTLQHVSASESSAPNFLVVMTDDCDMLALQGS